MLPSPKSHSYLTRALSSSPSEASNVTVSSWLGALGLTAKFGTGVSPPTTPVGTRRMDTLRATVPAASPLLGVTRIVTIVSLSTLSTGPGAR